MLEGVWGCSWRSVPVALGMRLGQVPRALGCSMTSAPGVLGISSLGRCLGLWECALALIPRAFGMLGGVGACSFGNAPWGQSPGLWGMLLQDSTRGAQSFANVGEHPQPGRARRGGKAAFPSPPCSAGKFGRSLSSPSPSRGLSCYSQLL